MKRYTLLIGNGLNRAIDNKAWIGLLEAIQKEYGAEESLPYTNLPLEFERIYLDARKNCKVNSPYSIKKSLSQFLPAFQDLSLHKKFTLLPIDSFLTTNYDYSLELSINPKFQRSEKRILTNERKHSLFRKIETKSKSVWHIHGEEYCPESICLGYDQYCTYLSKIITFLTYPHPEVSRKPYLRYLLEGGVADKESWSTMFFTHDIFILGLSMSFLEIDLWWLLSYRMRFILENPQYGISNSIHYFYAVHEGMVSDEQLSLLESMGVVLHPVTLVRKNWNKLYLTIFTDIESFINDR